MIQLFDILPTNFFSPLASIDKELYSNILFLIYSKAGEKNSYTFLKEELIDIIDNYFKEHNNQEIEEIEEIYKNSRDKATYIFRRLKNCGWLDTEYGENQQLFVNLEDYAIVFLNTYTAFKEDNNFELSSYVYSIYQSMKNLEIRQGYLTLNSIAQNGKNLINKLRSLNSNIKKYIKKIISLEESDQEEQLKKILTELLGEYKSNVIDKAYYYMKTNDNPIRYKREFLKLCKQMRNELERSIIIDQIMKSDSVDLNTANNKFDDLMDYLENIFDTTINIMEEIDRKNTKYINVSIEKIKILLINNSNIEGLLINILKNYQLLKKNDLTFNMNNIANITTSSLYTSKKIRKNKNNSFLLDEPINDEMAKLLKQQLEKTLMYSKKNINNYINNLLTNKEKLTSKDFDLTNKEEYIKLLLTFIYSDDLETNYKIRWSEEEQIDNILLPKFIIERIENNDR